METQTMQHFQRKDGRAAGLAKKQLNLVETKLSVTEAGVMEFSGYGAVFGNVDSWGDVIENGAFSAYLSDVKAGKQNWPAMLMQHGGWGVGADDMTPVGIWTDMSEDEFGFKMSGKLADTPRGSEAYALMKMEPRPAISGLSIGYFAKEYAFGGMSDPYDRLLKRIDLLEVSLVTFPANDKARIGGVKSARDMNDHEFERALRDVLGLSQKEAKTVVSRGFRALRADDDAGSEELKRMKALLERNANIF
jgi:HK97 family phage prohead protease